MKKETVIWERPWKYKESILISVTLMVTGFAMEFVSGGGGIAHLVQFPSNIYFGVGIIVLLAVLSFFGKKLAFVEWLESVPAAISSIALLLFVTLLMGFTMQYDENAPELIRKLGLSHIVTSWPYLLANLFLLLSLGLVTIKNLKTFKWKKAGFIISHLGLWIVLFGANFGSTQLLRLQMELIEGQISNKAIDISNNQTYEMPFAIKLNDFILEEYKPKLVIVDNKTGTVLHGNGKNVFLVDSAATANLLNWEIHINEYIYSSVRAGNRYFFVNEIGAAPSVSVTAIDENGNKVQGWVSCGSFNRQYESLKLNEKNSLVMLFPEPKEYTSEIELVLPSGETDLKTLQVNKPFKVGDWKLYQLSYDADLGRWSDTSVIELIYDPWIKIVYTGIFLMLIGSIYMFWVGTKKQS